MATFPISASERYIPGRWGIYFSHQMLLIPRHRWFLTSSFERGAADGDVVLRFALSDFGFFSEQFFNLKMKIFPFPVPAFASASQSVGSSILNPAVEM